MTPQPDQTPNKDTENVPIASDLHKVSDKLSVTEQIPTVERGAFYDKVEQLIGWAKAGKHNGYYLMDAENVDSLLSDVLQAHQAAINEAEQAARINELMQVKGVQDVWASPETKSNWLDKRLAQLTDTNNKESN